MDPTVLTILLLLAFATVLALIQARKRDKCLKDFDGYAVTLAEKDGDLTWGEAQVFTTGVEVVYVEPIVAREGHLERSYLFYKDQYAAMDALYRIPKGLSEEARARRKAVIERTANPGFWRRFVRRVQNWIAMVRDALMQAVGMVIGAAKSSKPGTAVLSSQEQQLKALSSEIIGHAGNAFDPMLETHLFKQVVVEVTRDGHTRSYCGWLKDYTSQFVEVLDAYANGTGQRCPLAAYADGDTSLPGLKVRIEKGRLHLSNESEYVLYVRNVEAEAWSREIGCVLPPRYTADLTLPPAVSHETVRAWIGTADYVDMVVPRTHALIRHGATGSAASRTELEQGVTAQAVEEAALKQPAPAPQEA